MLPFGFEVSRGQQGEDAKDYDSFFQKIEPVKTIGNSFDEIFQKAWRIEYGFDIDDGRKFIDNLEDYALVDKKPVMYLSKEELIRGGFNSEAQHRGVKA